MNMPRPRLALWLIGIGLVGGGSYEQLSIVVAVGICLVGIAVLPIFWPGDNFARKVTAIGRGWAAAVDKAQLDLADANQRRRDELSSISAPEPYEATHRRILELIGHASRPRRAPGRDAIATGIKNEQTIREQIAAMKAAACGSREKAYVRRVESLFSEFLAGHAALAVESERALSEAIARLEHLRVPRAYVRSHAAICRAYRDLYVSWSSYHRAVRARDVRAAMAAIDEMETIRAKMKQLLTALAQ
jgi:hypothetical protein